MSLDQNNFLVRRLRREKKASVKPDCNLVWIPRLGDMEDDHQTHKCRRFESHGSAHRCACGATSRVNPTYKGLGRVAPA